MRSMLTARRLCTTAPAVKPPAFTPAQSILGEIRSMLPRVVTTGVVTHGEPILYVEPKDVPIALTFLRDHTGTRCKQLVDINNVIQQTGKQPQPVITLAFRRGNFNLMKVM